MQEGSWGMGGFKKIEVDSVKDRETTGPVTSGVGPSVRGEDGRSAEEVSINKGRRTTPIVSLK